ncbi:MAG: hypothetical protein JNN13_12120 [Planctomycetes bacterium]|nr:hypothetical protein [Planctomycetota bacterium]
MLLLASWLLSCWSPQSAATPTAPTPTVPPATPAAVEPGLATRYPGDVGIANDQAVLFQSGFEHGLAGWTPRHAGIFELVSDPTFAHAGTGCAQATATRGKDSGGEIVWRTATGQDTLFVRFYCRFAPDAVWPHHFVKLRALAPGFDGHAGSAPPGDRGFWTGIEPLRGKWRFYTYWHRMRGFNNPGPVAGRNDDGTETTAANDFYGNSFQPDGQPDVPRDRWICVEAMLKANTPGRSDGEMAFWIDGVKIGHYRPGAPLGVWRRNVWLTTTDPKRSPAPFPGFDFRTTQALQINEVALLWYVSEQYAALGPATCNRVWFDDVVVATRYIGPQVAAAPR